MSADRSNPFKAKLVHYRGEGRVVFKATPDISESRTVNYQQIDPIHMPGSIMAYATTPSRTFSVSNIRFISQTSEQASENMRDLQLLRSWCLPRFGKGDVFVSASSVPLNPRAAGPRVGDLAKQKLESFQNEQITSQNKSVNPAKLLGMPPPILYFSAYSASQSKKSSEKFMQNINRVPVVITSLDIPYPSDVDYISNINGVPFPTILSISISLSETHSPKTFGKFDLDAYRNGKLGGF